MKVAIFTFNPFAENTYVLYDDSKECIIIDPGCSDAGERSVLIDFIESNNLVPKHLVNTHCHIDHVLGNKYVSEYFDLPLTAHQGEKVVLEMQPTVSQMYGIPYDGSPEITVFLEEGDLLEFGNTKLQVMYTPGHSPASISLYDANSQQLIAGDVLFAGSIGRTDLPGGDFDTLINSIKSNFFPLPDDVVVYPGHGESTTILKEKQSNPFLQD